MDTESPGISADFEEEEASLTTSQRRDMMLQLLRKHGAVRVRALARQFGVSEVTIRADLDVLEEGGFLRREHGGAVLAEERRFLTSLSGIEERSGLRREEKRRIAEAAARSVRRGDTVLIDAGTTVVEMLAYLKEVSDVTIVTNALNVAAAAGAALDGRLIVIGGEFSRATASNLGPLAIQALAELNVSKFFLGTQAFDLENGLTDKAFEIAQVKRAMINASQEVFLLADSSKWGSAGFIKVAPLSRVDHLITDSQLPAGPREMLVGAGIDCEFA